MGLREVVLPVPPERLGLFGWATLSSPSTKDDTAVVLLLPSNGEGWIQGYE